MTTKKYIFSLALALALGFVAGCGGAEKQEDSDITSEMTEDVPADSAAPAEKAASNEDQTENEIDEFSDSDVKADEKAQNSAEEPAPEEEKVAQEPEPAPPAEAKAEPEPAPPVVNEQADLGAEPASNRVTAINYLASANGGSIEIKTTLPAKYKVRPNASNNQYVIEIEDASLTESLKRPFIMKDFDGAFGAINAYQNPGGRTARVVVQLKGGGEPVVSQEGSTLLVVPPGQGAAPAAPVAKAAAGEEPLDAMTEEEASDNNSYDVRKANASEKVLGARTLDEFLTGSGRFFGRPISIQTSDADIRDVIAFIAEESGVNLVIADDVSGKVSLKLRQVPWDQALVIVMRSKGLGYVRQGNVLRITKLATLQAEALAAKEIVESQKKLTPLKVKVIPVNYAQVADLEKQIKPFLTEQRGQIVSDSRTSSVIITDTAEVLARVERLVKELDIPPAQVMIEGKIVEASETFSRRVGVNWSLSGSPVEISPTGGVGGTPISLRQSLGVSSLALQQQQAQNAFLNLRVGTMDFLGSLDATLSLAQSDNLARIISSPRIVTMNKEKSQISQESEVITINSTKDQSNNQISTAQRTPVKLNLTVTPQITAEGSVVLDVDLLRQFPGAEVDPVTHAKPINSRAAKTKVLVPNGQTAVIGGIYQSDETESETGVPGLKDIPVLGWLFKQKYQERQKNELLLFLTPRILNAKDQGVND
jgi:type IV pilus assembly protein PilQ